MWPRRAWSSTCVTSSSAGAPCTRATRACAHHSPWHRQTGSASGRLPFAFYTGGRRHAPEQPRACTHAGRGRTGRCGKGRRKRSGGRTTIRMATCAALPCSPDSMAWSVSLSSGQGSSGPVSSAASTPPPSPMRTFRPSMCTSAAVPRARALSRQGRERAGACYPRMPSRPAHTARRAGWAGAPPSCSMSASNASAPMLTTGIEQPNSSSPYTHAHSCRG